MREKREKEMKAYDEELQKIMTPEQYKSYKADMEKRRQEGPRGPRGPRGQRGENPNA
jgi:Spy/CpxP family protein refolding chaperone